MIRSYRDNDYDQLRDLYNQTKWYGGVFDEARDSRQRLAEKISQDPDAILVFEEDLAIKGTISIIDDGRVAMLYRFVTDPKTMDITRALFEAATSTLRNRGHEQILVYSDPHNPELDSRYRELGMTRGGDYSCYWVNL